MEGIDEILSRIEELDKKVSLLLATKGRGTANRDNTPIPDSEMTDLRRRMISMLNRSGRSTRNLTYSEVDKINYYRKVRGSGVFRDEFLKIEQYFKDYWKNPDPNKPRVVEDLMTLLNNWARYVDKSDRHEAKKPKPEYERLPEPDWGSDENGAIWKQKYEEIYRAYPYVEWNMLTPKIQHKIIEKEKRNEK